MFTQATHGGHQPTSEFEIPPGLNGTEQRMGQITAINLRTSANQLIHCSECLLHHYSSGNTAVMCYESALIDRQLDHKNNQFP